MVVPGWTCRFARRFLARSIRTAGLLGLVASMAATARADDFGRIIGTTLFEVPQRPGAKGNSRLSLRAIEALPEVVRGERSALIVATTDQGNLAKLLVSGGLRRGPGMGSMAVMAHVISLDRFETIDRGDRVTRTARGRDIVLFNGFEFDLDTGQVVPAGFGGDLTFSLKGENGPELVAVGANRLYAIDRPLTPPGSEPGRPSSGTVVLPTDFNGRYTLVSNGQLSGALEVEVAADGAVSGRFRSDRNGSVYPVTGRISADLARRITFEIQFPRSKQAFDGLLWTGDKNVFAGTVQVLEHPYSFIAVREGMPLVPEAIDAASPPRPPAVLKTSTRVVALESVGDACTLDGVPKSTDDLRAALAGLVRSAGPVEVLVRVPAATPFEKVQQAVQAVRGAGVSTIRLSVLRPQ